jgi:hypothetical protein
MVQQSRSATPRQMARVRYDQLVSWAALALLWLGFFYIWVAPLIEPRGEFGWGHYRKRDIYLGVPIAAVTFGVTLVMAAPAARRRQLSLRLMTGVATALAAIVGADVAFSFGMPPIIWYGERPVPRNQNTPDAELGWVRLPHLRWVGSSPDGTERVLYRTDEHGFRNAPGLRRADIVFIGDSYTEATGVREEETYVGRLGAASGLRVVNLGRSGYGPQQELIVLRRYGLSYQPRMVVWQLFEYNDLMDAEHYKTWRESKGRLPRPSATTRYSAGSLVNAFMEKTARASGAYQLRLSSGEVRPQGLHWTYRPEAPEHFSEGFSLTKQTIKAGYDLCRSRNIELVIMMVPTPVRFLADHLVFGNTSVREEFLPNGGATDSKDFTSQLGRFCRKLGCPLIDLYPALRDRAGDRPLTFINDGHLTVAGNEVVASELFRWLQSRGLVRGRSERGTR